MTCKGICVRYKAVSNHYINGNKRCQICELFLRWDELYCPCCGCRLRVGSRNPKLNARLRERRAIEDEAKEIRLIPHLDIQNTPMSIHIRDGVIEKEVINR
jgi:hypothetical protein